MTVIPDPSLKILVTGGAGFIGSHLIDYLMTAGHEVYCVDNLHTGVLSNLKQWSGNPKFHFIHHDVVDPLPDTIMSVDQIYHLACPASPVHYQSDPIKTMKTNVIGTLNVSEFALKHNARLLLASTSEVYGDPEMHPQKESYCGHVNPCGPRSCYDEGKRAAETVTMDYHRYHGLEIRIIRIFNTYGPRMIFHDGRVVSNFIVQALRKEPITIYGDGSQTRSFCYVSDLVDGIVKMMNSQGIIIGPVNLGNPVEFEVRELADLVKEITDQEKLPVEYRPLPRDDPRRRKPDIDLARNCLNWEPKVKLREGIIETVKDFRIRAEAEPDSLYCMHQMDAMMKL
jgi:UDP-glucuronate decarboxylase